jgi:hypothetical protein
MTWWKTVRSLTDMLELIESSAESSKYSGFYSHIFRKKEWESTISIIKPKAGVFIYEASLN